MADGVAGDGVEQVCDLERRLLQRDVRADADELRRVLDEEFVEFGASGRVFGREGIIRALVEDPGVGVESRDMRAREVSPGAVLVSYTALEPGRRTLRSSLWVRRGGGWRMRFHQGTVVPG